MEFTKVKGYKQVASYIRKVKCSICGNFLLSIYARNKQTFLSVEDWFYCEKCNKVFKLDK